MATNRPLNFTPPTRKTMPHFVVEYSKSLEVEININDINLAVFKGGLESELFSAKDIKVRAIGFDHYKLGGEQENFVHVAAKILPGRDEHQRKKLAESVISELEQIVPNSTVVSVETLELDGPSYSKCSC